MDDVLERKYSVFLSSTSRDLSEHRKCAIDQVNKEGHIPISMEFFSNDHRKNSDFIQDQIAKCDVFVIIIGTSIGQEISPDVPFTEFEYDTAQKLGKTIIRFVCQSQDLEGVDASESLVELREKILNDGSIAGWFSMKSAESVSEPFSRSLRATIEQIQKEKSAGWVRSEQYDKLKQLRHLSPAVSNSPLARQIVDRLEDNRIFLTRSSDDHDEKCDMADFFWRMGFAGVFDNSALRNIFFESSSSAGYMSQSLIKNFRVNPHYSTVVPEDMRFGTNSLISYLSWIMQPIGTRFPVASVDIVPQSQFTPDYGAAYGPIQRTISIPATGFMRKGFRLRDDALTAVEETTQILDEFLSGDKGLIFMSLTGLTISDNDYSGGWVSSYRNCLFKRALLRTGSPKVFIVDGKKWDVGFDPESRYPIFTGDLAWDYVISDQPVCFVLSTKIATKAEAMIKYFRASGFHKELIRKSNGNTIIMFFNKKFLEFVSFF